MARKPAEVFTPRNSEVNESMYIARPDLETALERGINGTLHVILHGESGSGKSWLYKQVLNRLDAEAVVANLASAARVGSIVGTIQAAVHHLAKPAKTGYAESKSAEVGAIVGKGGLTHTDNYVLPEKDALEVCYALMRRSAGTKTCCLVLDNLETIFESEPLMSELGEIVILLDDSRYAQHKIKLVIVGVPSGVREYFSRVQNRMTVSNRLQELPEVAALTKEQVNSLVRTGVFG